MADHDAPEVTGGELDDAAELDESGVELDELAVELDELAVELVPEAPPVDLTAVGAAEVVIVWPVSLGLVVLEDTLLPVDDAAAVAGARCNASA